MKPSEVRVSDNPAAEAAEQLVAAAGGHIALSGGSTPKAAYELAAQRDVDWSGTTFWFGDDRAVPPDHEHSNYLMAKAALLDHISGAEVRRIKGELGHQAAADDYEAQLRDVFEGQLPALDLDLLGLGPDGHTASLFPNDPALGERERFAVGVETPGMAPLVSRVTLTLPVLNAARKNVFLVAGEDKAEALRRAFGGAEDPGTPASLVRTDLLIADPAAVEHLR